MNSRSPSSPPFSPILPSSSPATVRFVPTAGETVRVSSAAAQAVLLPFAKPGRERAPEWSATVLRGYRGKRLFDLAVGSVLLAVLSPLLVAVVGMLALMRSGNWLDAVPAVGLGGRPIRLLRFRTRPVEGDAATGDEPSEEGVVRLRPRPPIYALPERWLLASGWDRLPGLWNVLAGQIHLVGSAPRQPDEAASATDPADWHGAAPPGLFCPWRKSPMSDETAGGGGLDALEYVARQGWWTDLCVVFRKLWAA